MQVHPSQPQAPRKPESISPHTILSSESSPGPPHRNTSVSHGDTSDSGLWGWRDKEGDVASRVSGLHLLNSAATISRAPLRSKEAKVLREMKRPSPSPSAYITYPTCQGPWSLRAHVRMGFVHDPKPRHTGRTVQACTQFTHTHTAHTMAHTCTTHTHGSNTHSSHMLHTCTWLSHAPDIHQMAHTQLHTTHICTWPTQIQLTHSHRYT